MDIRDFLKIYEITDLSSPEKLQSQLSGLALGEYEKTVAYNYLNQLTAVFQNDDLLLKEAKNINADSVGEYLKKYRAYLVTSETICHSAASQTLIEATDQAFADFNRSAAGCTALINDIFSSRNKKLFSFEYTMTLSGERFCCRHRGKIMYELLKKLDKPLDEGSQAVSELIDLAGLLENDPYSGMIYGYFYSSIKEPQTEKAMSCFEEAADKGNEEAKDLLPVLRIQLKQIKRSADTEDRISGCLENYYDFVPGENGINDIKRILRSVRSNSSKGALPFNVLVRCSDISIANDFAAQLAKDIALFSESKSGLAFEELESDYKEEKIKENRIIYLRCFNGFSRRTFMKCADLCKSNNTTIFMTVSDSVYEILRKDEEIFFSVFRVRIRLNKIFDKEKNIFEDTLKCITQNGLTYTEAFAKDIEAYIRTVYPKARLKDEAFVTDLFERLEAERYKKPVVSGCLDSDCVPFYVKGGNTAAKKILAEMTGLGRLKKELTDFENFMRFTKLEEKAGRKVEKPFLHMLFLGNPGTGKTTAARIVAQLLYEIGCIRENKLVTAERKDLVGEYIGKTAPKTAAVISKAVGGVLFIDEAYSLTPHSERDYGREAISTLLTAMVDHKEDLVIIFAGYTDEMNEFVEYNPGMQSRIGFTFHFDDYTNEELCDIFVGKAQKQGYRVSEDALDRIRESCEANRHDKHFGNGRFIEQLFQQALMSYSSRAISGQSDRIISKDDIPSPMNVSPDISQKRVRTFEEIMSDINALSGLEQVKKEIRKFSSRIKYQELAEQNSLKMPAMRMHMLFLGNPGTGKTTVARLMAELLYSLKITQSNKLVTAECKDLIAEYVGQTAVKTANVIRKALGGVLFIDEAYSLVSGGGNDFGKEAIATLLTAMEDHKDELVVILAGYSREMQDLINSNSGILSRIGYTFHFEDYSAETLLEMFVKKFEAMGYDVTENAKGNALALISRDMGGDNFGNARYIEQLVQQVLDKHIDDVINGGYEKSAKMISGSDVEI